MSEKDSFTRILLHAENNYESLARTFMGLHDKGQLYNSHVVEMENERRIVNLLQVIGRDPEGFRAWADGIYQRFGPMLPRKNPHVAAMEELLRIARK